MEDDVMSAAVKSCLLGMELNAIAETYREADSRGDLLGKFLAERRLARVEAELDAAEALRGA
jgi:hypothetical protein